MSLFEEKIAICFTLCGQTYVKSAIDKLNNFYFDDPNLYYFVITDNAALFSSVNRRNLIVTEINELYDKYPEIEPYEKLFDSTISLDDIKKIVDDGYLFPFALYRFHLLTAIEYEITNVAMVATDSKFKLKEIQTNQSSSCSDILTHKNIIHNAVSTWREDINASDKLKCASEYINNIFGMQPHSESITIYDEACRFYVFENIEIMKTLFDMWHRLTVSLFESEDMQKYYRGWVIYHDEHYLALIYHLIGINRLETDPYPIFEVHHDMKNERPWRTLGEDNGN